ncbi:hypothetical protein [Lactobacillus amylovorus]|uniref:hypothetical protein n=1 Tax=Lactobacillus amylovorus TaxID=1604 RepID=UPI00201D66BF|nr:hypothetical protein [Lactobacillus amylovorus]
MIAIGLIIMVWGIAYVFYAFWYDKNKLKPEDVKEGTKPLHKRFTTWLMAVILTVGGFILLCAGIGNENDDGDSTAQTEQVKKVNHSKNLPGQKINKSKATKHEFYWTSKDDKKVRYFVSDGKITAIKVVLTPDQNNTVWCQDYLANVLHDNNLKYTSDKQDENNVLLSNKESYDIYSPKAKKWYWVRFDAGEGKNMVASFAIYPGKGKDAQ